MSIGAAIHAVYVLNRLPVMNEWPGSTVRALGGRDLVNGPRAVMVDSPIPTAGVRAILCFTPGVFRWERPVDAGTTVTVSIAVRKTSDYIVSGPTVAGMLGYRNLPRLPFLRVTRSDGYVLTSTMSNLNDTWVTLTVVMPIVTSGVLVIEAVQTGTRGDNNMISPRMTLAQETVWPAPRCWWSNLKAVG